MPTNTPNTPPNSAFVPRKEFLRESPSTLNSFALLAISSSSCIRLYSFPLTVVTTLRRFFDQQHILLAFREDFAHNLCEFTLDGKPWSSPKAVATERLLLDILTAVYQCGYTYLSTIDYGRENDDRLVMAFSAPSSVQQGSRSGTPLLSSNSPSFPNTSGGSLPDKTKNRRVPFALSFVSATVMRAIAPPLHLTPAILQGVRGSWPRGVVSEKKIGENCFEFKLKGYKWFQQDNFAVDSLQHILSLLTSLDFHSFSLLTSISLTNRSRVKDLWIFTGPVSISMNELPRLETLEQTVLDGSHPDLKRKGHNQEYMPSESHKLISAEGIAFHAQYGDHSRTVPEDSAPIHNHQQSAVAGTSHMLRKPAPRAQIPVSVVQEDPHENEGLRIQLPSTISSGVENMTGVGTLVHTPELLYSSSPYDVAGVASSLHYGTVITPRPKMLNPSGYRHSPLRPVADRPKTPPPPRSQSEASSESPPPPPARYNGDASGDMVQTSTSNPSSVLLGSGIFRDSAFSSNTEIVGELPMPWSGFGKEITELNARNEQSKLRPINSIRSSSTPAFPGGWQPTAIEEKIEEVETASESKGEEEGGTPIHEVESRIDSPELVKPGLLTRKSEAAVVGMIASTGSPSHAIPSRPQGQRKESQTSLSGQGGGSQGWVLVNVGEGSRTPTSTAVQEGHNVSLHSGVGRSSAPGTPNLGGHVSSKQYSSLDHHLSTSAVPSSAKAIVIVDAMESKHKKAGSSLGTDVDSSSSTGVRRFFSLNRKNSGMREEKRTKGQGSQSTLPRSGLVERLRLIGTPEASRREDKRRSID
ncbi:hypothetical protein BDQ17DRAFT_1340862 [Cyathus striatus]|nr:hypothetical protein BDQ17DRAFT_1340862 [Cyathus striatus]